MPPRVFHARAARPGVPKLVAAVFFLFVVTLLVIHSSLDASLARSLGLWWMVTAGLWTDMGVVVQLQALIGVLIVLRAGPYLV